MATSSPPRRCDGRLRRPEGTLARRLHALRPPGLWRQGGHPDRRRRTGSARIDGANNNYWIYWLDAAQEFQGGELVELVALSGTAALPIHCVLFLAEPPAPREQSCAVDSLACRVAANGSGDVRLSWISENPVPTRLEYGNGDFSQVCESASPTLLHRAVLRGLDPETEYQARGVGRDLAGKAVYSETVRFRPRRPAAPPTVAETARIPLTLRNPHATPVHRWPVRSGIPFPQGKLGSAQQVRLLQDGQPVPADIRETAHWPDYSVKWIMVAFVADCPAGGEVEYELEWGAAVQAPRWNLRPMMRRDGDGGLLVDTGAARFRISPQGELLLADGQPVRTHARLTDGTELATGTLPARIAAGADSVTRAEATSEVEFADGDGGPVLTVATHFEFWAGSPFVKLSHSFLVQGKESHSHFEEISLALPLTGQEWQAGLQDGTSVALKAGANLYQREFTHYLLDGGKPVDGRFAGQFRSERDLVVLRQFWEHYPKGFRVAADGVRLDLCPTSRKATTTASPST